MIDKKPANRKQEDEGKQPYKHIDNKIPNNTVLPGTNNNGIGKPNRKARDDEDDKADEVGQEVLVVVLADADGQPWTVMVVALYAVVAG